MVCTISAGLNNIKCALILFYRPPNATHDFTENLNFVLEKVHNSGIKHVCLLGDLNMPDIQWDSLMSNNNSEQMLCNVLDNFNLVQCNPNPSREGSNNILDVIFVNDPNRISDVFCDKSILPSDHLRVNFKFKFFLSHGRIGHNQGAKRNVLLYKQANYDELCYLLDKANLCDIIANNSYNVNTAWVKWKNCVLDIVNKHVPRKTVINKQVSPWIDGEVVHLSHKKESARKKAKSSGKDSDWAKYKAINNKLKNLINKKHSDYLNQCFDGLDTNPKKFWGLVSHKSKKGAIPHEMCYDDITSTDASDKANMFNQFFYSQYNSSKLQKPNVPVFNNLNLSHLNIAEIDVLNVLIKLDVSKAYGPDGLATIIYKNCANVLAPSLTMLFNLSLDNGVVPTEWKVANVVPIHKKGPKNNVSNYRPISLLPVAGKILERCVHQHLYSITREDIIKNQHGFMSKKSTTSQLVQFYDNVFHDCDNSIQTDVTYLDLTKAFDSVPHDLLLLKLNSFGINGKLLSWISNYLSRRKQKVVIEGKSSTFKNVISGVPQGSILGPLFFLYYINDMCKSISDPDTSLFLYADDSKLSKRIVTPHDCDTLQQSINELSSWATTWGMAFNATKCCIMSFTKSHNKVLYQYKMNNVVLSRPHIFVDLGVTVCDNLKWDEHVNNIVSKANKRLGLIKRCIGNNCSMQVKLCCYTSLVRPLLESSSSSWSCYNKKLITKIESVQRRASKYILKDYNTEYDIRLSICNLLPLSLRRDYLDLVLLYNYIHDLVDIDLNVSFAVNNRNIRTRNVIDDLTLATRTCKNLFYEKLYVNRVAKVWNSLPYELRNTELTISGNNTTFKKALKTWLTSLFHEKFDVFNTCTWLVYCGCNQCRVV
jgi:hypothetical protein